MNISLNVCLIIFFCFSNSSMPLNKCFRMLPKIINNVVIYLKRCFRKFGKSLSRNEVLNSLKNTKRILKIFQLLIKVCAKSSNIFYF